MADEDIPKEPMTVGSERYPTAQESARPKGMEGQGGVSPMRNNAVTDSMRGNYANTGGTQDPNIGAGNNNMEGSIESTGTSGKRRMNV